MGENQPSQVGTQKNLMESHFYCQYLVLSYFIILSHKTCRKVHVIRNQTVIIKKKKKSALSHQGHI